MLIHVARVSFFRVSHCLYIIPFLQPLHPEDRAEVCHDVVFRAIKATCCPRTFDQLTKCTHEWWDSNIHEPFRDLDQYLAVRRVNIAMASVLPLGLLFRLPFAGLTSRSPGPVLRQR